MSHPSHPWTAGLIALVGLAAIPSGQAIQWRSTQYKCVASLPDGDPRINPWLPMMSYNDEDAELLGLTGAHRTDKTAYVYVGVVPLAKKPNYRLNEKAVEELEKRYFSPGLGFRHTMTPLRRKDGLPGYRLTGTHHFNGVNYSVVLDLVQANNMVYEVAGLTQFETDPMKDPDVRGFMENFRITR